MKKQKPKKKSEDSEDEDDKKKKSASKAKKEEEKKKNRPGYADGLKPANPNRPVSKNNPLVPKKGKKADDKDGKKEGGGIMDSLAGSGAGAAIMPIAFKGLLTALGYPK